jgi:hypothetical protein
LILEPDPIHIPDSPIPFDAWDLENMRCVTTGGPSRPFWIQYYIPEGGVTSTVFQRYAEDFYPKLTMLPVNMNLGHRYHLWDCLC